MRYILAIILLGFVTLMVLKIPPNWDVYKYGSPEEVQAEINNPFLGGRLNAENKDGWSPLMVAAGFNTDEDVISGLLDAGADLHARTEGGVSPLMLASGNNHIPVIMKLLEYGADLEATDGSGWTPLMYAAIYNTNTKVISELLKAGAEIEARDHDGWTPLMCAARFGLIEDAILVLLKAGADPKAISKEGESAHDLARENAKIFGTPAFGELDEAFSAPK
jgi:uncharacterized protein